MLLKIGWPNSLTNHNQFTKVIDDCEWNVKKVTVTLVLKTPLAACYTYAGISDPNPQRLNH